ncbi:MAG: hypothetical protein AB7W28_12405 [Armatimonadota bacterium]
MVSQFETTAEIDYEETLGTAGKITPRYSEMAFGQGLYNALSKELTYGGWPSQTVERPDEPYVLICGNGGVGGGMGLQQHEADREHGLPMGG